MDSISDLLLLKSYEVTYKDTAVLYCSQEIICNIETILPHIPQYLYLCNIYSYILYSATLKYTPSLMHNVFLYYQTT